MSQVISPAAAVRGQLRSHWVLGVSALLALLATAAVVLVLAIEGGSSDSLALKAQPALRSDGGPDESSVAATVTRTPAPGRRGGAYVDESRIAAAIAGAPQAATRSDGGPEESAVAGAVAGF